MGQKVNPHGLRVGVIKEWDTRWYADKKTFSDFLVEDKQIRDFVKKECFAAGVSSIEIERKGADKTSIIINTAKPGIIIGRQGAGIEEFKKKLQKKFKKNFFVDVREIKNVDANAQLVAENIASQLERRVSFRRAMKMAMSRTMKCGAKGIKTASNTQYGRIGVKVWIYRGEVLTAKKTVKVAEGGEA